MTNKQFKNAFLRSEISHCLSLANACARSGANDTALEFCNRALAYARQLPDQPKWRALRAHTVTACEALSHV